MNAMLSAAFNWMQFSILGKASVFHFRMFNHWVGKLGQRSPYWVKLQVRPCSITDVQKYLLTATLLRT